MIDKGTAWRVHNRVHGRVHSSGGSDVWTTITGLNDTRGNIKCACLIVTNRLRNKLLVSLYHRRDNTYKNLTAEKSVLHAITTRPVIVQYR